MASKVKKKSKHQKNQTSPLQSIGLHDAKDRNITFQCILCDQSLRRPRELPCYHSVCETCLHEHIISSTKRKDQPDSFPCPVCSTTIFPPSSEKQIQNWAAIFPLNKLMMFISDDASFDTSKGCDSCKRTFENSIAKHWCDDCQERFCDNCLSFHSRMKVCEDHMIVELPLGKDARDRRQFEMTEYCSLHCGKTLELFCSDHSSLCCVVCLTTKHQNCRNIHTVEESADIFAEKGKEMLIRKTLSELKHHIESVHQMKTRNIDQLDRDYSRILHKGLGVIVEVKNKLDKLYREFKISLLKVHEFQKNSLELEKDAVFKFQKSITQTSKMYDMLRSKVSTKQLFLSSEKIKIQIANHHMMISTQMCEEGIYRIRFQENENFAEILNKLPCIGDVFISKMPSTVGHHYAITENIRSLRQVSDNPATKSRNNTAGFLKKTEPSKPPKKVENLLSAEAVRSKVINGKTATDYQDCWFRGGLFLENDKILLADFYNKKIKGFDGNGICVMESGLPYAPRTICFGKTHAEILISSDKSVISYKLTETSISASKNILKRSGGIHGVCMIEDYIILTVQNKVEILKADGTKIKEILKSRSSSAFLANGMLKNFIYSDSNAIISCTLSGEKIFEFRDNDLRDPNGIAVDSEGNIYVCCGGKHCVYQLEKEGMTGRIFLRGFKYPHALGFNARLDQFFVTTSLGGCQGNKVEIFEFSND